MRIPALIFGLVCGLVLMVLRMQDPYFVRTVREIAFDQLQISNPRPYSDVPVRIVDIDEAALKAYGQWPWPRSTLARLVERLDALGAAAIAFDIVFIEPDRLSLANIANSAEFAPLRGHFPKPLLEGLPDNDRVLAAAIARTRVALGFAVLGEGVQSYPPSKASFAATGERALEAPPHLTGATRNLAQLEGAAAGLGSISLSPASSEGVLRRVPLLWSDGRGFHPSLALEALRLAQQEQTIVVFGASDEPALIESVRVGQFEIPTARDGEMWIYYSRETPRRFVSAKDILAGLPDESVKQAIEGSIVFIGTSAVGLLDIRTSARGERIAGVSVHAQILEQILSVDYLTRPDWIEALELVFLALMAIAIITITIYFGPVYSLLFGAAVAAVTIFGSYLAFVYARLLVDFTFPLLAGAFLHFLMTAYRYFTTDRDKRMIRAAFAHYVAPSILKQIEKNPGRIKIGGEVRDISVLFLDVRSFTSLSERLPPTDLVAFLNRLFAEMTKHIVSHQGTLDKYIGDSIMAFWNAPTTIAGHERKACEAALAMRAELKQLNAQDGFQFGQRSVLDAPIGISIGIGSGLACVGNIGSDALFNYSAIGDSVNIASRVQDACKHVAFDIVVSEPVANACPQLSFLYAGEVSLKGKTGRLPLHILVGGAALSNGGDFATLKERHQRLVAAMVSGDPIAASYIDGCIELGKALESDLGSFYERLRERRGDFSAAAGFGVTPVKV